MHKIVLTITLITLVTLTQIVHSADFFIDVTDLTTFPEGLPPNVIESAVSWLDYDNDGLLDFIITGTSASLATQLYQQNSNHQFTDVTNLQTFPQGIPIKVQRSDIASVDYDGNGFTDFVLIGWNNSQPVTQLFSQNSSGFYDVNNLQTFPQGLPPNLYDGSVRWIDYDSDGFLDLMMTGEQYSPSGMYAKLYRQNITGGFYDVSNLQTFPSGLPPNISDSATIWVDYDNNGNQDFLFYGQSILTKMALYSQNTTGKFYDVINTQIFPDGPPSNISISVASWIDYNNDSEMDLFLTGSIGPLMVIKFYRQNASGFYDINNLQTFPDGTPLGVIYGSIGWADYNNDGLLDFIYGGLNGTSWLVKIYRQNTSGIFHDVSDLQTFPEQAPESIITGTINWIDFNNDSAIDLMITGQDAPTYVTKIYRNGCLKNYFLDSQLCIICSGVVSDDQRSCLKCNNSSIFNLTLDDCQQCPDNQVPDIDQLTCDYCQEGFQPNDLQNECQPCSETQIYNNTSRICENFNLNQNTSASNIATGLTTSAVIGITFGSVIGFSIFVLIFVCGICCSVCIILMLIVLSAVVCVFILIIILMVGGATIMGGTSSVILKLILRKKKIYVEDLTFNQILGSGAYGQVYLGTCRGETVAIKKLNVLLDEHARKDFVQEAEILARLDHPYVIKYITAIEGDDVCYLVLEFAAKGSLESLIKKEKIPDSKKLIFAYQIAVALKYLHSQGIIHRDLSCRNVLVTKNYCAKLTDFGLSRVLDNNVDGDVTKTNVGPIRWLPIEFIMLRKYSKYGDIHMFGMFLYELLAEKVPYSEIPNLHDVVTEIRRGRKPTIKQDWQDEVRIILTGCWEDREEDRISVDKIIDLLSKIVDTNGLDKTGKLSESSDLTDDADSSDEKTGDLYVDNGYTDIMELD